MGLGLSVYSTVFVGLMGATSALSPIVAQHFGGGRLTGLWGPPWGIAGMWLMQPSRSRSPRCSWSDSTSSLPGLRRSRA